MESKEQELQRSIAFFEKFQATQTARVRVCVIDQAPRRIV